MIQSPAAEVAAAFLVARGMANRPSMPFPEWCVTVGTMPPDGDDWITIYDLTGFVDGKCHQTGETMIHPEIQIAVRHKEYNDGWQKINQIVCTMSQIRYYDVTTSFDSEPVTIVAATVILSPLSLYEEEKNRRRVFVTTLRLSLQET